MICVCYLVLQESLWVDIKILFIASHTVLSRQLDQSVGKTNHLCHWIGQHVLLLQILHKTEIHRFIQNDSDLIGE